MMEFTVGKAALVKELNLIQGIVEKQTTIPILANVLLETAADCLHLTGTDLETGLRCSCPARVKKGGSITIPAKRLLDYVRLLPEAADIKFAEQANNWISLVCASSKARIAGMARDAFPELPTAQGALAEIPIGVLSAMIAKVDFAASRENSRFTIDGALLLVDAGEVQLVATDGHRLALTRQTIHGGERCKVIIPRKAMAQLQKLASIATSDAIISFSRDANHLFFEVDERTLISREIVGEFPDFKRVLPKEQPHSVGIGREQLRAAIQRVGLFANESSHLVRLSVSKGTVKLASSDMMGESEEDIPTEDAGSLLEIGFNGTYLLDFLRSVSDEQVRFLFNDPQCAGEFRPAAANEDHRYVVMPMRV